MDVSILVKNDSSTNVYISIIRNTLTGEWTDGQTENQMEINDSKSNI